MNLTVLGAIFRRDFVNYFSNATGYVFICIFVVLTSYSAFWPDGFFSNNLANLDQLSERMPLILLVFIPAITMSIWAEEKRRGTDELLLTLPASDLDVVLGKYLAGVAIFTVSLLFSMLSVQLIFSYGLGTPDPLLFCCTYLGYWLVGLAMLATGMVASFLTSNLTVAFILAVMFNAPQAVASFVDRSIDYLETVPWLQGVAQSETFTEFLRGALKSISAFEGFSDFSRGVVSLGGALHFVCIVALMLYICMILIGRRHWAGGEDGQSLGFHFAVRAVALLLVVGGLNTLFGRFDPLRFDMTTDQINSLSDQTVSLVRDLGDKKDLPPIKIDAYVSPNVPSEYAGQKAELLSVIEELRSISGGKIVATKHEVENFSEEAELAERTYGIEPRTVTTRVRGSLEEEQVFLGAAIRCGLDKVVIPFLDKGIPAEYELVRSISTVADEKRKRLGVVKTDVPLFQSFSMQGERPESRLVTELKKQYDVLEVDPTSPIADTYDVLLAVQPSGLAPAAFDNFVAAVKRGQPTAIFEDPMPVAWGGVVGTDQPKRPGGGGPMGMFGGGGPPQPKGDMDQLYRLLGARMDASQLVWQRHNPYARNLPMATDDWVFVDAAATPAAFSAESEITAGMKQALFLYAGGIGKTPGSKTEFLPLAVTNEESGYIPTGVAQGFLQQMMSQRDFDIRRRRTSQTYILAAHIRGAVQKVEDIELDESIDDEELRAEAEGEEDSADAAEAEADDEAPELNVVFCTDIDGLSNQFFDIRAIGADEVLDIDFRMQNVTLVLNILDDLAGDERFLAVRKRTRDYRTLEEIQIATADYEQETLKQQDDIRKEAEDEITKARERYSEQVAKIENDPSIDPIEKPQRLERVRIREQRKRDVTIAGLEKELSQKLAGSERELQSYIRGVQDRYKFLALVIPPIPPLLVGVWVYFRRRAMEKEGVSKDRLRYAKSVPTPAKKEEPVGAA
ncbi:MAG: Gldg family protein [Planctomycetota bacterium]